MAEEPEQVLPQQDPAVGRVVDVGPKCRSAASPNSAAVRIGNAIRIRIDVTRMFQVKIGIRNIVMPGARMHTTVVIMLTAPRMVPRPATIRPVIHRSPPAPGEWTASDSGV